MWVGGSTECHGPAQSTAWGQHAAWWGQHTYDKVAGTLGNILRGQHSRQHCGTLGKLSNRRRGTAACIVVGSAPELTTEAQSAQCLQACNLITTNS